MAPTEGRFARPERRWDCRRGTPEENYEICSIKLKTGLCWSLIFKPLSKDDDYNYYKWFWMFNLSNDTAQVTILLYHIDCCIQIKTVIYRSWLIDWAWLYRLYGRRFLQVWWPNQQCQSTEGGRLVIQTGLNLTMLTSPCYNTTTCMQILHKKII